MAASPEHKACGGEEDASPTHRQTVASTIDFLMIVGKLKSTRRRGWLYKNMKDTESVADHMHRMGIMAMIAPEEAGVNICKCVKMALVHDIAEAIVGDITPHCGVKKEEKHQLEMAAIRKMCEELGAGMRADEVCALWNEYEANETEEAKFVKDIDKVELILQTVEYETERRMQLDEMFEGTVGKFQTPVGKAWAAEVCSRRPHLSLNTT